jgi:multidrug efflux pump subunit AcrA (membrane-fusion protein)
LGFKARFELGFDDPSSNLACCGSTPLFAAVGRIRQWNKQDFSRFTSPQIHLRGQSTIHNPQSTIPMTEPSIVTDPISSPLAPNRMPNLPPISRWTTVGGILLVSSVAIAAGLSSITEYRITVPAPAQIRPAGELRLVQAATEGQVARILNRENQFVSRGEVIATLDNTKVIAQQHQLASQGKQIQLGLAQFDAQIRTIDTQIQAESARERATIASYQSKVIAIERNYHDKQLTAISAVQGAAANVNSAQNEWREAQAKLKSNQADYLSEMAALKTAIVKRNRYQGVSKLGALSRNQIEEAELAVEQQQQKVSSQQSAIEAQQQNIGKLQQNVNIAIAKLQTAKTQLDPSNADIAVAQASIPQEQATTASAIALLNREKQNLFQKKIELQREFDRNRQELEKSKLQNRETRVLATTDGIIAKLNLRNPGQIVKMGEEVAQLLPEHNPLAIEATVSPSEISKIAKGQRVEMKVSACPYPEYGTLGGKVTEISADTSKPEPNPKNPLSAVASSAVSFYRVRVQPEKLLLQQGKNKCPIKLGMEGGTEIVTSQETFLQFLMRKARLAVNF